MNRHAKCPGARETYGRGMGTAAAFVFLLVAYLALPAVGAFSEGEHEIFSAGNLVITTPPGHRSAAATAGVSIRPVAAAEAKRPPRPANLSWMVILGNVMASGSETTASGHNLSFVRHITITVSYPAEMESLRHTTLDNLRLLFWDPQTDSWVEVGKGNQHDTTSASYRIGPFRVNQARRTVSVTVMKWPLGDPCLAFGG